MVETALAGELKNEDVAESQQTLDDPDTDVDEKTLPERKEKDIAETEFFEEMQVPFLGRESERRRKWLTIPRKARAAIRKFHYEF